MSLVARLDRPLPASLPLGSPTAVFLIGVCFDPGQDLAGLELLAGDVRVKAAAHSMPRSDVSEGAKRRIGFWGTVPIPARGHAGVVSLRVSARLAGGAELSSPLGEIEIVAGEPRPSVASAPEDAGDGGLIAVCMATFEPDMALFETQIESLREQIDDRWVCVISDDCSGSERYERMLEVIAADQRFIVSRSPRRLGFYRNFERALTMAPAEAELIALCDQDDRWRADKLRVLRESLGSAVLAYSDQRLVDGDGRVLRETLWKGRANNSTNLASMLVANTITGAAMLFRREVADLALPFPDTPGFQFHDHWLALVGLCAGDVSYVDQPLYDYVQHPGAVFGDVTHGRREATEWNRRLRFWWRRRRATAERWRASYFYGYLAREVQAQTLLLRCASLLSERKRRALTLFLASSSAPTAFVWLAARPLRCLFGRTETLATEIELMQGIVWRWLVARHANASFPPPQSFSQKRLRRWRSRI